MIMEKRIKKEKYLGRVMLIVFILLIKIFDCFGESQRREHVITYTRNHLEWDKNTKIDSIGMAELSLFNKEYENVNAEGKAIAPGTDNSNIIKIKNKEEGEVDFTLVLYNFKLVDNLPVNIQMSGSDFVETNSYVLPGDIKRSNVIKAIKGKVKGNEEKTFNIDWNWIFEESEYRNKLDTELGNKEDGNRYDMLIGLYVIAEDVNKHYKEYRDGNDYWYKIWEFYDKYLSDGHKNGDGDNMYSATDSKTDPHLVKKGVESGSDVTCEYTVSFCAGGCALIISAFRKSSKT